MTRLYLVDAFADRPFTGNPAAVCLLDTPAVDDVWLAAVAGTLNQPAVGFCWPEGDALRLRWFAPTRELELCGHATLATAFVLRHIGRATGESVRFQTRAGELSAAYEPDGAVALDFPLRPPVEQSPPPGLLESLGIDARWVGGNGMDWLVEVATEADVLEVRPDFARLKTVPARAAMVTARATRPDADFVSRFFAPSVGIDEDQVTGSAHCALLPFWADRLGRDSLTGYQASPRGGFVRVRREDGRAKLIGRAVLTAEGRLAV